MNIKHQRITKQFALYCGDCCEILPDFEDESIGFTLFSPPFADLYSYSDDEKDMSNASSYEEFFGHFEFLVRELFRLTMPGRVVAVHCMDLPTHKSAGEEIGLRDFPGDIVRAFQSKGFVYHSRVCIWKDPLLAAVRTHAIGLAHKQIVKDSAMVRHGIADTILAFRKPGENPKPIGNEDGLTEYNGSRAVPRQLERYSDFQDDQKHNKRSHWIWQQYASPVWFDVRQTRVLPYREAKHGDDQKHICPLQLDTIERCMTLWSAKGDVVLSPFAGVGSEVYVAVKRKRKAIGIELKRSYYRQALRNLKTLRSKEQSKGLMGEV